MTRFYTAVSGQPLDLQKLVTQVSDAGAGAVSTFLGMTRNSFEGKKVVRLEYEAFEPMANKILLELAEEAAAKWELVAVAIEHRTGIVPVLESSVIIAVSSAHRKASLEAVSFLIDALKEKVPIWKKEVYDNKKTQWKANVITTQTDLDASVRPGNTASPGQTLG